MHLHDSRTHFRVIHHSAEIVGKEQHLAVADVGQESYLLAVLTIAYSDIKARVRKLCLFCFLQSTFLQVLFPRSTERRIGDAEVVCFSSMTVTRNSGVESDILSFLTSVVVLERLDMSRNHKVCLASGISVWQ